MSYIPSLLKEENEQKIEKKLLKQTFVIDGGLSFNAVFACSCCAT